MIFLRTGLPGASKTLNSLRELVMSHDSDRRYYYTNIKLLMLDVAVVCSFSGWFYGWYWPRLKDKYQRRKIEKILKPIHDNDEFATIESLPWLTAQFESHDHFETWLYWVRRVYPKKKLIRLEQVLDAAKGIDCDRFDLIKGLNLDFEYFEDPKKWRELPKRSVILVDECQQFFPPRSVGSKVPDAIKALETHRHGGYDLHFVTQDRTLCDANLRKLVGRHIHYFNPFGGANVTRKESPKVFNPDDYHESKQATKKPIKRDTKFYGVYWSAEKHTTKFKMPSIVFGLIFCLGLLGYSAYSFSNRFFADPVEQSQTTQAAQPATNNQSQVREQTASQSLSKQMATMLKDVYISGSLLTAYDKGVSFDYSFYRSGDDAVFHPSDMGLLVQPVDNCLANIVIGDVVHPVTCNPFYVRVPVEDERDLNTLEEMGGNPDQHKPNISLF